MLLFNKQYSSAGPALIILHGLFGQQGNWTFHARALAEDFSVYGFDARNHGESGHTDSMSYPEMAEDLRQTMDELGIDQAAFIGHSMGGKIAMQFALNWPERVSKLVVVDMAPVAYTGGPARVIRALLKLDLSSLASRKEADELLQADVPEKGIRDFVLTNLRREGEHFRWRMNLPVLDSCFSALGAALSSDESFTGPTLFVKGEMSDYLSSTYQDEIMALFPAARIEEIADAGHWVHSEKPQEFLQMTKDFLLA